MSLAIASAHLRLAADPIDVDLVVRSIPRGALPIDRPFRVACTLGVMASVRGDQQRTLSLAVQHVQLSAARAAAAVSPPPPPTTAAITAAPTTTSSPVSRSYPSTMVTATAPATAPSSPAPRAPLALLDELLVGSPRTTLLAEQQEEDDPSSAIRQQRIPPPEPITTGDERRYENLKLRGATRFLGASTLLVPPMTLVVRATPESSSSSNDHDDKIDDAKAGGGVGAATGGTTKKEERFWEFELEYAPLRTGFVPVGGLRVLLLEDRVDGAAEAYLERRTASAPPVVLREWDVIGEIWVKS
jgi:trafficking protein particle complex subunit 13